MNTVEFFLFFLAQLTIWSLLSRYGFSRKQLLTAILFSSIPLFLALETATQYTTIDEDSILGQVLGPPTAPLALWELGAMRTTLALLRLPTLILRGVFHLSMEEAKIFLLAVHWYACFALILWVFHLIRQHFIDKAYTFHTFLLFITGSLLLPTNHLGLQVANYDMAAMLLALLSCLYTLVGIEKRSLSNHRWAIALGFLSAQEKLTGSPFLLMAIIGYLISHADKSWIQTLKSTSKAIGIPCAVSALSFLLVAIPQYLGLWALMQGYYTGTLNNPVPTSFQVLSPLLSLNSFLMPLTSWGWPILYFSIGVHQKFIGAYTLVLLAMTAISCILAAKLWQRFYPKIKKQKIQHVLPRLSFSFLVIILTTGLIASFCIACYWYRPGETPLALGFIPSAPFDGSYWTFGAHSASWHKLLFSSFSYHVFILSLPSVCWVLVPIAFLKCKSVKWEMTLLEGLMLLCLCIPLAHGIVGAPVIPRYFNMTFYLLWIVLAIRLATFLKQKEVSFCCILLLIFVLELAPFRPMLASFRPFWYANQNQAENIHLPQLGHYTPPWMGWGEEFMLFGKKLLGSNSSFETPTRFYHSGAGKWLPLPGNATAYQFSRCSPEDFRYTENDYYIVNRIMATIAEIPFPAEVEPIDTISWRGFPTAWIFRGDQLAKHGFQFQKSI